MFRKTNIAPYGAWRVLSLRNGQISIQNPAALAFRTQIWFTPEVIIADALCVIDDLLWFWRLFRRAVSLFALRVLIISSLMLSISFSYQSPNLSAATLEMPNSKISKSSWPKITSQLVVRETISFNWPTKQTYISSYFSSLHKGIDIPNQYGSPVRPITAGEVVSAGWESGGFGQVVMIRHSQGYLSRYCHLSLIYVRSGDLVGQSDILGAVGTSGLTTGPHLHLEIYKGGQAINPLGVLPN